MKKLSLITVFMFAVISIGCGKSAISPFPVTGVGGGVYAGYSCQPGSYVISGGSLESWGCQPGTFDQVCYANGGTMVSGVCRIKATRSFSLMGTFPVGITSVRQNDTIRCTSNTDAQGVFGTVNSGGAPQEFQLTQGSVHTISATGYLSARLVNIVSATFTIEHFRCQDTAGNLIPCPSLN